MDLGSIARSAARAETLRYARSRIKHRKSWTEAEDALVRKHFPNRNEACRALPHRTWLAIRGHAGVLGLRKPQMRWLASELSTLRRLWCGGASRAQILAALPRYSWPQIISQKIARGFHRPPRSLLHECHPVINQIKARARELNMSMHDVDELAGSGRYFLGAGWMNAKRPNPKWVAAAVQALDGEVLAKWND